MEYKLCDWTCHRIETLTADQQLALAQQVASNLMQNRVLLGRFLLAIKRTESYENCGASSVIHFASLQLGLEERQSREVLLVAQRLESLPVLTDAVERNLLSWCKLRALLRQATPENERSWLSKALRHPMRVLERLLRQEAYGSRGLPPGGEAERVHLHLQLTVQEMALFQQSI